MRRMWESIWLTPRSSCSQSWQTFEYPVVSLEYQYHHSHSPLGWDLPHLGPLASDVTPTGPFEHHVHLQWIKYHLPKNCGLQLPAL